MTSIPMPSSVNIRPDRVVRRSRPTDAMRFTQVADSEVNPRVFVLTWRQTRGEVLAAIRDHHRAYFSTPFELTLPRSGERVWLQWMGAPSISWQSSIAGSATGEFEEVLAHE